MKQNTMRWRKSSYSVNEGGNCVEVAWVERAVWRKSSHSANGQGNCVEVARLESATAVRDSKNTVGPVLAFPTSAWRTFLRTV